MCLQFQLSKCSMPVSRDERNEYHGITVERARKVLDALGVRLVTRVEVEPMGVARKSRGKAR